MLRVPGVVFSLGEYGLRFGSYYIYIPNSTGGRHRTSATRQIRQSGNAGGNGGQGEGRGRDAHSLSIVHRKGLKLDGTNPTIVFGYGAYGIPEKPFFRPTWLPWFDRGGVLAIAHVRGGGEVRRGLVQGRLQGGNIRYTWARRSPAPSGW